MSLPPTPPLSTTEEHEEIPKRHLLLSNSRSMAAPPPTSRPLTSKPTRTPQTTTNQRQNLLTTLSAPKAWLTQYSSWVQRNASSVAQIESALRSLNYIIPSKVREGELLAESYHSSVQLLSLYHDNVLLRAVSKLPGMPKIERPLNRYTKYWTVKSPLYRRTAFLLQCVRYTELLWEMAAKRRGEKVRWRVVVVIELIKAVCRLILLRVTGGRMVVPPLPDRDPLPEEDLPPLSFEEEMGLELPPSPPPESDSAYGGGSDSSAKHSHDKDWTMPRTGLTLPSLPNASDISTFLMKKVLTADDIKPAMQLLQRINGGAALAEILHTLRPLIYAVAMSRSSSKKSWQPWLLGVSIELAARQLRSSAMADGASGVGRGRRETPLEKEEWDRRGWAMGWWGLRGAFYENVSKRWVEDVTESRWVPGLVGGILKDYSFLWEEYVFATADM